MLQIHDPKTTERTMPLFRLGFRPLFLFGSAFSILALSLWVLQMLGLMSIQPHGNLLWWHGHEMLFGFTAAIIVGFLLTAVQNWTGNPGLSGTPLKALVLLWLLPRVMLINNSWVPIEAIMLLDLAFLPISAWVLAEAVIRVKQWRNLIFVPVLLLMTLANAISYYGLLSSNPGLSHNALYGAAFIVVFLIALLGGRVIPFFTERATKWQRRPNLPWLEAANFIAIGALVITVITQFNTALPWAAGISSLLLLVRFCRWGGQHSLGAPLLWSLHLSYLCIPLGLMLIASGLPVSAGFHLGAVGGMGGMILAMMARVSLGHTGRTLTPPKPMTVCFGLILLGAALRAAASLVPSFYLTGIWMAGIAWILAFGGFCYFYGKLLCQPRLDGRPG
ncbi:NnrS family protein [Shewanella corallii]|uniref:NnrS family protein n=1 Tax=Shewanella corallii TaxID=560080 RepID=A0ABT0NB75_9GAMM|nr:NnrS family protein [Shewanella corallii]MCL2915696.1 NnrS family protein [Shewanella corallii]